METVRVRQFVTDRQDRQRDRRRQTDERKTVRDKATDGEATARIRPC